MRLTLRTLLAYLDDILEPTQAKEIGEKLNESSFAASLVSRIREVMRRRRLTAPTLSGPGVGIDPNTVAEYLDNTLPPDGVADVEKICLESDVHLAETAACHQILTLALGEPVEISARTRERMYALGPTAPKVAVTAAHGELGELSSKAVGDVLAQAELAAAGQRNGRQQAVTPAPRAEIPEYLRSHSSFKRVLGYTIALVVLVVWGVTVFKTSPFKGQARMGQPVAQPGQAIAANQAEQPEGMAVPEQTEPEPGAESPGDKVAATEGTARRGAAAASDAGEVEPAAPAGEEAPGPADKRAAAPAKPPRDMAAAKNNGPKPGLPAEDGAVPPVPPPSLPGPSKYVSAEGITLHYVPRDERWFVLPRRSLIHVGDTLAVPEPFQCLLEVDDGKALVTMTGRTAVRIVPPTAAGPFGLELLRGQFVVRSSGPSGEAAPPLRFGAGIAGELWHVELHGGAVCGLQINPLEPTKFEQTLDKNAYFGAFYVSGGKAVVTDPSGGVHEIKAPDWLELPLLEPGADGKPAKKQPLLVLPKWMGPQTASTAVQLQAKVFEKRFALDEAVELSLPEQAADPNPIIAQMATECLGLIEAYSPLVSVLRSQHGEARKAAIFELREWLPRNPNNKDLLKTELAKRFPPEDAAVVYRLLWGFDADDARNREISVQLIDWMADPEIAIRELAFYHVYRLTGKDREYRPDATPAKLRSSLRSWQDHVKKDGSLIPLQKPVPNPQ